MCIHNPSCRLSDGSCDCSESIQNAQAAWVYNPLTSQLPEHNFLALMLTVMNQQDYYIQILSNRVQAIQQQLVKISENQKLASPPIQKVLDFDLSKSLYKLKLINELPSPAYKGRPFSIIFQLVDKNEKKIVIKENLNFKVLLFTSENPPKMLKNNISGDSILKGTTEIQGNSLIKFSKVIVSEVSSHFNKGCFLLAVQAENTDLIEPFISTEFIVKARKMTEDECLNKRQKTQEER